MIDPSDFEAIDKNYFEIIGNNDYCITIRSRNTLHEWHLMERIANGHRTFVISHRHGPSAPYHLQQNRPTVEACCDYIRGHDEYHLEKVRKQKEQRMRRLGLLQPNDHIRYRNME